MGRVKNLKGVKYCVKSKLIINLISYLCVSSEQENENKFNIYYLPYKLGLKLELSCVETENIHLNINIQNN